MRRTDLAARLRLLLAACALSLAACGGDGGGGGPPTQPPPVVPPVPEDPQALLTDEQLVTRNDPAAPSVNAAAAQWIAANHHVVRSLTATRGEDLRFLEPILAGKRLVQLGESGHGVKEFNQAKVRLIRYLHEEQGFNVLAFESGIFECWAADREAAQSAALTTMNRCIFGVWRTEEVRQLFDYVRETRNTARPLRLAGFDVQISGNNAAAAATVLRDVVAKVDAGYAARVRTLDSLFVEDYYRVGRQGLPRAAAADSFAALEARGRLLARYDSLTAFLDAHQATLAAAYAADPTVPLIARQHAWSRGFFIREMMTRDELVSFEARDEGMAGNVTFLLERLYPGEKVIVWAHNAHIAHDRARMAHAGFPDPLPRSMGSWIAQRHRAELYTVGLLMYRGSAAFNNRAVYPITAPQPNSIEALFYTLRKRWTFVDMRGAPRSAGTEWMYGPYLAKEWGINWYRMVPRDQFDGILFIDTVSPPDYIL
jgi:erythromycin esterase